jgi:CDP-glycerol glycerophosphotransferase (TagB/SpsB family)
MNDLEFGKFYNEPGIIIDRQIQYSPTLGWNPDRNQLLHFANLVKYSDVQVNIASTATIEAAILDRPVVNVAFSTIQPEEFKKFIIESVFENHFKPILDYGASYIAKDPDDLIKGINRYLLDPSIHHEERKQLKEAIVYKADGKSTDRVSQTILKLLNYHPEFIR